MKLNYSIVIQWSDEDKCYIASLPEWGEYCHTHGNTYEETLQNALEVLELLQLNYSQTLPQPLTFENHFLTVSV